ncbi:MAG: Omp28-related outer membrane protein [Bacteroidetes bacterium]|nr:Omp28-related outer membrane protein [Bacteroidota bacterium]MCL1968696.1 Omp28-related outer membrane protein [Bacteroidota bacterium]
MKKLPLLLTTLSILLFACNKIDTTKEVFNIINPVEVTPWNPEYAKTVTQKIYVEEYTGHKCLYCPAGARELKAIMDADSTIIATAIHCSELANPDASLYFNNNYKTPMGDQLCKDFGIVGLPKATINRTKNTADGWGFDRNKWRSTIAAIDRNNVRAGIQLHCTANEVKQEIEVTAAVTIIKELPNPVQLCLILQQDNIISGQVDGNDYILEYPHNHVLRTGFKGHYGTKLTSDGIVNAQSKYSTTFKISYGNSFPYGQIPVEIKNCSVVAYLLDVVTKEVIQVEQVHLH